MTTSMHDLVWFICQQCNEAFRANPHENAWCFKCAAPHLLCKPCKAVHLISASEEDHYLAELEQSL
jgi:hypothetical protein